MVVGGSNKLIERKREGMNLPFITQHPISYASYKVEPSIGQLPCQNCGRLVTVILPFLGCVFCSDCMKGDSGTNDGSEVFYEKRRLWSKKENLSAG